MLIGLLCLQPGCVSPTRELERSAVVAQLHEGQSQAEVRRLFGLPKRSEVSSAGRQLDRYGVLFPRPSTMRGVRVVEARSLHILYDAQGRVEKFTYYVGETKSTGSSLTGQWQAGQLPTMDKVNQIQRFVTTHDQLVQMFGPATVEGLDVNGNKMVSWFFLRGRKSDFTGGRELVVALDDNQVVVDYRLRNFQP